MAMCPPPAKVMYVLIALLHFISWYEGRQPPGAALHSSREQDELWQ